MKPALPAGLILLAALLYIFIFKPPALDNSSIENTVLANLKSIETALAHKVADYKLRASFIFNKYRSNKLAHSELEAREALITAPSDIINDYYGEIYYFKFKVMAVNEWLFSERKNALFFMQKMADNIFYVKYFCHLDNNFMLNGVKYNTAIKEITIFKDGFTSPRTNSYQYDEAKNMFFYTHLLEGSNNQLAL
ncbi:MAG: hypothetical protein MUF15_18820, partial [Acidobacteria bacterium]|nr:hypothetical protein [Acidobacteriota bacterium]